MKTIIKFTFPNRQPVYGIADYPPVGEWSESRNPVICQSGWHVSNDDTLASYLGQEMWIVEVDGRVVADENKSSYEKIRFVSQIEDWDMVEFAYECAGRAKTYAARAASYASYAADAADAADAAYAATRAASYASYAADAADAADAAYAATAATAATATAAAYAAATAAAYAAAYAAERKWQSDRLREIAGLPQTP